MNYSIPYAETMVNDSHYRLTDVESCIFKCLLGHAAQNSRGKDCLVDPAIVSKTSIGMWAQMSQRLRTTDGVLFVCITNNNFRQSPLPYLIVWKFLDRYSKEKAVITLFYLRSQQEKGGHRAGRRSVKRVA